MKGYRMLGRLGVLVAVVAAVVGCDGYNKTPNEICQGLQDRWGSLVAPLSRACRNETDCVLAGGVTAPSGSMWAGIAWQGVAVSEAAYSQSDAPAIEPEWQERGCGYVSDPLCPKGVTCAGGLCQVVDVYCPGWGPRDSGVPTDTGEADGLLDASGPADATPD